MTTEPRYECATCGAVRPQHEIVRNLDSDTGTERAICRDCLRDGKASTGIDPLDAWVMSILDSNVKGRQRKESA